MRLVTSGLAAFVLVAFTGCQSELWMGAEAYSAQHQSSVPKPTPPSPEVLAAQRKLAMEYLAILNAAFPDYNGIHIEIALLPDDLMANHPLFTGYEFDAGPLARVVTQWIAENRAEFATAKIARVGIFPNSGHERWFNTAAPTQ